MSFGGFSDIQRDRDRAHSSRHRNAGRGEELGEEHEDGESGYSKWSAGTYRGRSETEEETEEESGHEEGHEEQQQQQQQQQQQPPKRQRGDPGPTGGNSYATNNPALREATTNGAGAGAGGGVNWGSAAEAGIAHLAKAYDKSASVNKEPAGSNGNVTGKSSVFGQRLAEREEPESGAGAGAGAVLVKQAFGGVKATIEKLTGERK